MPAKKKTEKYGKLCEFINANPDYRDKNQRTYEVVKALFSNDPLLTDIEIYHQTREALMNLREAHGIQEKNLRDKIQRVLEN